MNNILNRDEHHKNFNITYEYEIAETAIEVPEYKFGSFTKYIKKINRFLQQLEIPNIEVIHKEAIKIKVEYKERDPGYPIFSNSETRAVTYYIDGFGIILKHPDNMNPNTDWELASVVDHDAGVLNSREGYNIPRELVDLESSYCDHCKTRRRRHKTIIIFNRETNEFKRVGGTCIKNYLGIKYERFLSTIEGLGSLNDWGSTEDFIENRSTYWKQEYMGFNTMDVLNVAVNYLKKHPYVSAKNANSEEGEVATSWRIFSMFSNVYDPPSNSHDQEFFDNAIKVLNSYSNKNPKTKDIIEWIKKQDSEHSDYWFNVHNIIKNDHVNMRQFGYLISTIPSYWREVEKQKGIKKEKGEINNEWVGKIGDKIGFETVTVFKVTIHDGDFGEYHVYNMEDAEGHRLVKFGTINGRYITDESEEIEKGTKLSFTGEIKGHKEFKEIKSTQIGRVSKYK